MDHWLLLEICSHLLYRHVRLPKQTQYGSSFKHQTPRKPCLKLSNIVVVFFWEVQATHGGFLDMSTRSPTLLKLNMAQTTTFWQPVKYALFGLFVSETWDNFAMQYSILYRIFSKLPVSHSYHLHNLLTSTSANFDHMMQQYGCAHAFGYFNT